MNKVLITGILGQDGANMAELLLKDRNNLVYGMMRRSSNPNYVNIKSFNKDPHFKLVIGDLSDEVSINDLVKNIQPDFLINFAANSFVGNAWSMPVNMFDVNALGVLRCLEAIKNFKPECRFYSSGSSEQFGDVEYRPQDMNHPFKPRSPYAASKCAAHHLVKVYRESYGLYAIHGILFNHEGTKRGQEFVTRKITSAVARIHHIIHNVNNWRYRGIRSAPVIEPLQLGYLDAKRDWSDSEDFVGGVWLMLNQEKPKDYLLASGEMHSIREFVEKAFEVADFKGKWVGKDINERYVYRKHTWEIDLVTINPEFYRPAEVEELLGDPTEAKEELGWEPKGNIDTLIEKMVKYDIEMQAKRTGRLPQVDS